METEKDRDLKNKKEVLLKIIEGVSRVDIIRRLIRAAIEMDDEPRMVLKKKPTEAKAPILVPRKRTNPNAAKNLPNHGIPVVIHGIEYPSMEAAFRAYGMGNDEAAKRRINYQRKVHNVSLDDLFPKRGEPPKRLMRTGPSGEIVVN